MDGLAEVVREARGLNALFPHTHGDLGGGAGIASPKREASPVRAASPARAASPVRAMSPARMTTVHVALKPTPPEASERAGGAPFRVELKNAHDVKESLKPIGYYFEPNGRLWVLPIFGPDALQAMEELQARCEAHSHVTCARADCIAPAGVRGAGAVRHARLPCDDGACAASRRYGGASAAALARATHARAVAGGDGDALGGALGDLPAGAVTQGWQLAPGGSEPAIQECTGPSPFRRRRRALQGTIAA